MNSANLTKPNAMSDLSTWLRYLEQIHPKTIELGLDRAKTIASQLDVLHPAPYVFTVAGTNGKGTTCRALEMILLEAGLRVGVYSSPHLLRYTERVRINNQELADSEHVIAFNHIENQRHDISLTYFEYSTLSALWLFKQANLDVVILEVGLGGRLDATNIIDANIAVITSIALDHVDYLGNTRESIAFEKAGVFKSNRIAIVGEPDAPDSIYQVAKDKSVQLHICSPNRDCDWQYQQIDDEHWSFHSTTKRYDNLPMAKVPLANAATAIAALSYSALDIEQQTICNGLMKTALTGRLQVIQDNPLVIIDVAHNPHAASYLQHQLQKIRVKRPNTQKLRMIIGMLKDKDIASTVKILSADVWYCASLYGERGTQASEIASYLDDKAKVFTFTSVEQAFHQAMQDADNNDIIVVCGSFHTVSEVLSVVQQNE